LAPRPPPKNSPKNRRLATAYTERREGAKGVRYRGFFKDADGRYKCVGTYDTAERALEISQAAEKRAERLEAGSRDPRPAGPASVLKGHRPWVGCERSEGTSTASTPERSRRLLSLTVN
jgi:hypothetical protein